MAKKQYFEIDTKNRKFIIPSKYYSDIYDPTSDTYKALKAVIDLGIYQDYGMEEKKETKEDTTFQFNEEGIRTWINDNNPAYLARWEISGKVKNPKNKAFSFMVRKNLFLYDNPAARAFCGIKTEDYKLTKIGEALLAAVKAAEAKEQKEKK